MSQVENNNNVPPAQPFNPPKSNKHLVVAFVVGLSLTLIALNFSELKRLVFKPIQHAIVGGSSPQIVGKPVALVPPVKAPVHFGPQNGMWGWHTGS